MMKSGFLYLLAATILALLAIFLFIPGQHDNQDAAVDSLLLPGLAAKVNDVERVEIISAGNTVVATLLKNDDRWQVEQMDGYHADWPKLRALLAALAQAKVIEVKTDKPQYYERLGVEDVVSAKATGVLVRLTSGADSTGVLVGKRAQGSAGQFVRVEGSAASALLDRTLDVATEQLDWADKRIVDIKGSEVAEVEIIHPQAGRVLVTKISADQTDFDLVGLPADREIQSTWAVNSLGSALSLLDLETVRPDSNIDWAAAVRMRVLTFSGLEIMAEMLETDGMNLLRLTASYPAAQVVDYVDDDMALKADDDVAARVTQINQRVSGWAYGIARYKFETMVKTQEDILKPVDAS